ncbi:MlaE family ABC transporter permease [Aciditerrimonas ferrireducens]|uniref:MlaE family ABC transporter permease n=1 Tax=Aciditerrimonas ferrireducens TaxID=667306 RepID=UPI0020043DEF|nr:ABC transporter permease [Aciditerrimonas ferrireducens]MCK4177914.1 ABC transporter permease [Aciditerrimonas ferrireducens]
MATRLGRRVHGVGEQVGATVSLIADQVLFYLKALWTLPKGLRHRQEILALLTEIAIGPGALIVGGGMFFVVMSISFFTGTEVGLEGYAGLQQIGAQAFTGVISSLANTREITPLVAGVALAAQVGAGFTAQIGAMRISEEIDALEVMSVDSFTYLVSTRIWAALICMIPLYLAALFASFIATQLVVTLFFGLSPGVYQYYFHLFLPPIDIAYSFVKAMVFTVVVVMIHCYYGYRASGGPAGVGVAAGRAIRASIISVVVLNLLLTFLLFGGVNVTARLVG